MEKRTSFVVDISNTPSTLIVFVSVVNIFLMLLAWNFLGMVGFFIVMMLSSGFIAYKLLRPNELMLKIENKTATLYKNQVEIASCPDHQLEISFTKHYRWGYSIIFSRLNESFVARVHLKFPNGKRIAYSVASWSPEFAPDYPILIVDFKSIINLTWDVEGNNASEMQTQRLIDYYNLNHLLTFNVN